MRPLALPTRDAAKESCHVCGKELTDHRIATRDTNGNMRHFDKADCFELWAEHNLSGFLRRST